MNTQKQEKTVFQGDKLYNQKQEERNEVILKTSVKISYYQNERYHLSLYGSFSKK